MAGRGKARRSGGRSIDRGGGRRCKTSSSPANDGGNATKDLPKEVESLAPKFGSKDTVDTKSNRRTRSVATLINRSVAPPVSSYDKSIVSPTVPLASYDDVDDESMSKRQEGRFILQQDDDDESLSKCHTVLNMNRMSRFEQRAKIQLDLRFGSSKPRSN